MRTGHWICDYQLQITIQGNFKLKCLSGAWPVLLSVHRHRGTELEIIIYSSALLLLRPGAGCWLLGAAGGEFLTAVNTE